MRGSNVFVQCLRRAGLGLAASVSLLIAASAVAGEPTYGVRVYELFQRGPKLMLQERTSRAFAPHHVRNIELGEVWPPEDMPPIKVYRSRDHVDFFGSYWREDGTNEYGQYEVEIWEVDGPTEEPGVAHVRVRVVERADAPVAPTRRNRHPEHDEARRTKLGR